jgi:hypothetical protein
MRWRLTKARVRRIQAPAAGAAEDVAIDILQRTFGQLAIED